MSFYFILGFPPGFLGAPAGNGLVQVRDDALGEGTRGAGLGCVEGQPGAGAWRRRFRVSNWCWCEGQRARTLLERRFEAMRADWLESAPVWLRRPNSPRALVDRPRKFRACVIPGVGGLEAIPARRGAVNLIGGRFRNRLRRAWPGGQALARVRRRQQPAKGLDPAENERVSGHQA
jgi:hypothetical protein